jgi:hypothetical protein
MNELKHEHHRFKNPNGKNFIIAIFLIGNAPIVTSASGCA